MYAVIRYTLLNTKELKYDTYTLHNAYALLLLHTYFVVVHFVYIYNTYHPKLLM